MGNADFLLEPWKPKPVAKSEITQVLSDRTESLIIERLLHKKGLAVDRLTEKLALAAAVVPRQVKKIEARADALIAREPLIEKKTDATFLPHEQLLDQAEAGMTTLDKALSHMANDPLSGSGS